MSVDRLITRMKESGLLYYFRATVLIIVGAGCTDLAYLPNRVYSLVISNEGKTLMAFVNVRASAC